MNDSPKDLVVEVSVAGQGRRGAGEEDEQGEQNEEEQRLHYLQPSIVVIILLHTPSLCFPRNSHAGSERSKKRAATMGVANYSLERDNMGLN